MFRLIWFSLASLVKQKFKVVLKDSPYISELPRILWVGLIYYFITVGTGTMDHTGHSGTTTAEGTVPFLPVNLPYVPVKILSL